MFIPLWSTSVVADTVVGGPQKLPFLNHLPAIVEVAVIHNVFIVLMLFVNVILWR